MMKLGEALIQAKLINRTQLSRALERQVIMGGRLGTSLIELGYVSEKDLMVCLSNLCKFPYAPFSAFINLTPEIIQLVPKEVAAKYHVLPLKKERNQIHLAMADPTNLEAVKELRFILGTVIIPYVASELRIQAALERYYGVPQEQRYVSLITTLEDKSPEDEPPTAIIETLAHQAEPGEYEPQARIISPLEAASHELVNIRNRDELGNIIIHFAEKILKRVVLFIIRGDRAFGWRGAGKDLLVDAVSHVEVDLRLPSFMDEAVKGKNFYTGPLLPLPQSQSVLQRIGPAMPQEILLFPITIKGKTVMVLYGDDGDKSLLMGDYEVLKKLTLKTSMALEILILHNKILGE